jgi:hypothetical protein
MGFEGNIIEILKVVGLYIWIKRSLYIINNIKFKNQYVTETLSNNN